MTRVDFYLLDDDSTDSLIDFTCRLIEKIRANGQRTHIHADDSGLSRRIDQALWNFKPESFIPHLLLDSEPVEKSSEAPVSISQPPLPGAIADSTGQIPGQLHYDLNTREGAGQFAPGSNNVDVTIGLHQPPATCNGVLINLSDTVPTFFSRFDRTLEIVKSTDSCRQKSRERYRFYQQRGYPLKHHTLSVNKH